MKQSTRITKAKETVSIIEQGYYFVNGQKVNLLAEIKNSIEQSILVRPGDFENILGKVSEKIVTASEHTEIVITQQRVLKAAAEMISTRKNIGCLNFASAKNPGGGFLGGAVAQEESLALSSALYGSLRHNIELYNYNRSQSTYLYSDYMIYSPEVPVFRNDDGDLLEQPYTMSFITSPATNVGVMRNNRPKEIALVEETMMCRMDKVLALFAEQRIEHLLLGA